MRSALGISIRYAKCWVVDGYRLVHGYECKCTPRDNFVFLLNMRGAE